MKRIHILQRQLVVQISVLCFRLSSHFSIRPRGFPGVSRLTKVGDLLSLSTNRLLHRPLRKIRISYTRYSPHRIPLHTQHLSRAKTFLERCYFQCLFFIWCKTGDDFLTAGLVDFKRYTFLQNATALKGLLHVNEEFKNQISLK